MATPPAPVFDAANLRKGYAPKPIQADARGGGALAGDNAYSGGITYSTPAYIFGSTGSVNGGYSFDLPLATVAAFNTQGLNFLAANTENARGFFTTIEESANAGLTRAENNAFSLARTGLGTLKQIAYASINAQENINYIVQTQSTERVKAMPSGGGGGFCFITTAICEAENLPDDCEELTTLRRFRDEYMMASPELRVLVGQYYDMAPAVVEILKSQPDGGREVFAHLKTAFIIPAIRAINAERHAEALTIYRRMVECAERIAKAV